MVKWLFVNCLLYRLRYLILHLHFSINHYLDVQYRLLREDFIKPLRDGIEEIRNFGDIVIPVLVCH